MEDRLPKNTEPDPEPVIGKYAPLFADDAAWAKMRCIMSSWLGTPYKHCTMVKGRGADCTLFIGACWLEFGILKKVTWDYYSKDWHENTHEEKVLNGLYDHFRHHANPDYQILHLEPDVQLRRGDLVAFALTKTGVSNHAGAYLGTTDRGKVMLHAVQSKGVSVFPLAGYFERHKSGVFRIMRRI
jgi:cell wall-associated NlpC family hydrolase